MLREFVNFSKFKLLHKNIFITVAKTSEKICRLNITSRLKVKVENVEKIKIRGSFFMFVESGCISTNIEFTVP